ncbi:transposase [Dactylosporangium sp. NPDC049525]|uniref:transposase n=1 Tax=Dactylosporangium sp. NPDC049525 TaxID=3154730 RepID=UPI0034165E62
MQLRWHETAADHLQWHEVQLRCQRTPTPHTVRPTPPPASARPYNHPTKSTHYRYRYSGLAPTSYESAGRRTAKVKISKIGSVELRQAMIALGTGIALHHNDFAAYKRRMLDAGKKPMVAAIAVAHRAHRLAFAVIRSQQRCDPAKWAASTSGRQRRDRSVMAADPATAAT